MEQDAQTQIELHGRGPIEEQRPEGAFSRRNLIRTGSAMGVAGVGAWAIAACSGGSGGSSASGQTTVAPAPVGVDRRIVDPRQDREGRQGQDRCGPHVPAHPVPRRQQRADRLQRRAVQADAGGPQGRARLGRHPLRQPLQRPGLGTDRPERDRGDDPARAGRSTSRSRRFRCSWRASSCLLKPGSTITSHRGSEQLERHDRRTDRLVAGGDGPVVLPEGQASSRSRTRRPSKMSSPAGRTRTSSRSSTSRRSRRPTRRSAS